MSDVVGVLLEVLVRRFQLGEHLVVRVFSVAHHAADAASVEHHAEHDHEDESQDHELQTAQLARQRHLALKVRILDGLHFDDRIQQRARELRVDAVHRRHTPASGVRHVFAAAASGASYDSTLI